MVISIPTLLLVCTLLLGACGRGNDEKHKDEMVNIEFLFIAECPSSEKTFLTLQEVVQEEGIHASIVRKEITTEEQAVTERFLGSPSIRVNGTDLEKSTSTDFRITCRVYEQDGKINGSPSKELIRKHFLDVLRD